MQKGTLDVEGALLHSLPKVGVMTPLSPVPMPMNQRGRSMSFFQG